MLPPAALVVADRLITTLMTLVDAVGAIATGSSTPTLPSHAAQSLFFRLAALVTTLIRISTFGIRAKPKAKLKPNTPARLHPAPLARRARPAPSLPRRPGWLLAALPDIAPAIAADLATLLADPALAALLATAPVLHRTLRPLLRGLDLTLLPPSPEAPPPRASSPKPHPAPQTVPATPSSQTLAPRAAAPKIALSVLHLCMH